jgi:tetratricopeptide (TPR) repeat protein
VQYDYTLHKDLGLSGAQLKKLGEISRDYMEERNRLRWEEGIDPNTVGGEYSHGHGQAEDELIITGPSGQTRKPLSETYQKNLKDLQDRGRKQIEATLTPKQIEQLKKIVFCNWATDMLRRVLSDPELSKMVGVTAAQEKKIRQLPRECRAQLKAAFEGERYRTFAVLTADQMNGLRSVVLQFHYVHNRVSEEWVRMQNDEGGVFGEPYLRPDPGEEDVSIIDLPIYVHLRLREVRIALGLSAPQRKKLQEINDDYQAELKNRRYDEERSRRVASEFQRRIESLLTPKQLATLRDTVFRTTVVLALEDSDVQQKLGLTGQQKKLLETIRQDAKEERYHIEQRLKADVVDFFTPQQQQKLRDALAELDARVDPKSAESHLSRGMSSLVQGKPDEAIAELNTAIRMKPKYRDAYGFRAGVYEAKGELDKAIADYNEAIRLDPKFAAWFTARGNAYAKKGESDKAMADYNEAIRLASAESWGYNCRGLAYQGKGELDKAIADFTEAIRLNEKNTQGYPVSARSKCEAYYNRSMAYAKKGDRAKADADLAAAVELGYKAAPKPSTPPAR